MAYTLKTGKAEQAVASDELDEAIEAVEHYLKLTTSHGGGSSSSSTTSSGSVRSLGDVTAACQN